MIFALVAAGLTLIFGMLDIPNFAYGAFYAVDYAGIAPTISRTDERSGTRAPYETRSRRPMLKVAQVRSFAIRR